MVGVCELIYSQVAICHNANDRTSKKMSATYAFRSFLVAKEGESYNQFTLTAAHGFYAR